VLGYRSGHKNRPGHLLWSLVVPVLPIVNPPQVVRQSECF